MLIMIPRVISFHAEVVQFYSSWLWPCCDLLYEGHHGFVSWKNGKLMGWELKLFLSIIDILVNFSRYVHFTSNRSFTIDLSIFNKMKNFGWKIQMRVYRVIDLNMSGFDHVHKSQFCARRVSVYRKAKL